MKDEFVRLIKHMAPGSDDTIILLGDYIDRGPDAKGVVDFILALREKMKVICLLGNHEQMFIEFFQNKNTVYARSFIMNGGGATLQSYCTSPGKYDIPQSHSQFFLSLLPFYENENYFFVHAGVPDLPLDTIKKNISLHINDILWLREDFICSAYKWEKTIVHGHSPVLSPTIVPGRINLDTGSVFGGQLSALCLDTMEIITCPTVKKITAFFFKDSRPPRRAYRFAGEISVDLLINGQRITGKTINYNELGVLMYTTNADGDTPAAGVPILKKGEIVNGTIGPKETGHIPFKAKVVRIEEKPTGNLYGLEFISLSPVGLPGKSR